MRFHSHANHTHFHKNGSAPGLTLIERHKVIWKWMGYKGQNTVKTVLSVAHLKQKTHIKYNQSPSHKICLYNEPV